VRARLLLVAFVASPAFADDVSPPPAPTVGFGVAASAAAAYWHGIDGEQYWAPAPRLAFELGKVAGRSGWFASVAVDAFSFRPVMSLAVEHVTDVTVLAMYERRPRAVTLGFGVGFAESVERQSSSLFLTLNVHALREVAHSEHVSVGLRVDADLLPFGLLFFAGQQPDYFVATLSAGVFVRSH
jgi:hypothetical protein